MINIDAVRALGAVVRQLTSREMDTLGPRPWRWYHDGFNISGGPCETEAAAAGACLTAILSEVASIDILTEKDPMTLIDFIPTLNPKYVRPFHLGHLCCALDKVGTEPLRRIFWHAPRHGVTTALIAAMQLRPELTFAYANSRTGHTDSILRKITRPGVFPADRPLVGTGISGAIFLDGYDPEPLQWSMLFTRLEPKASIFVLDYYGNHSPLFNMDRTIVAARALGFDEWNLT